MVSVFFGLDGKALKKPDDIFNNVFEPEWLEDDFVKQMILAIDKTEVIAPYCLMSPVFGQIAPMLLSGGVKACILILKRPDFYIDLVACGENCMPWLVEIFKVSDARVAMSGADLNFKGLDVHCICENDEEAINSWQEWCKKMTSIEAVRNMPDWFEH